MNAINLGVLLCMCLNVIKPTDRSVSCAFNAIIFHDKYLLQITESQIVESVFYLSSRLFLIIITFLRFS